jgi:hypothetical protein
MFLFIIFNLTYFIIITRSLQGSSFYALSVSDVLKLFWGGGGGVTERQVSVRR